MLGHKTFQGEADDMNYRNGLNNSGRRISPMCNVYQQPRQVPNTYNSSQQPRMAGDSMDMNELTSQEPVSITPTTLESTYYMAGILQTFIGERMRVQFLIGTGGPLLDINGTLVEVGANYIILQPVETDDLTICDLFSIKFVTVYR